MKKKRSYTYRGIASIFLAILVIFSVVAQVAGSWAEKVNELLGVTSATITRSSNPADYKYRSDYATPAELIQAEIGLNTRLAAEGSVVLKGQPALSGKKVTLFGMRSGSKMQFGGSMGELINPENVITLEDAMKQNGFDVNPALVQFYKDQEKDYSPTRSSAGMADTYTDDSGKVLHGSTVGEVPLSAYKAEDIGSYKDAAVIVIGRDAGESAGFYTGSNGLATPEEFTQSPTGNILSLTNDERDLVKWVESQGFGKIVVLLNSASGMEIEELKRDDAIASIVWIGNPGAYGTLGIAKLLSGEILPSGHLPDTFAVNTALSAAAQNFGVYSFANAADIETTTNNALRSSWYLVESEGIYTGYKYYETRYFDSIVGQGNATLAKHGESTTGSTWAYDNEVSYAFGYGIEGSTFSEEITSAKIDWTGQTESVFTVKVTNTGDKAAKHAVQLYVSLPYTQYDRDNGLEKAAIQLVGYAKTGEAKEKTFADVVLLAPGESEELTITFNAADMYSYDRTYAHDGVTGAWSLEAGDYVFATGNGAHDAVQAVLKAQYPDRAASLAPTGAVYTASQPENLYRTHEGDVLVKNQLNTADLNYYHADATVTWLTRNDWANTFPVSIDKLTATEEMITLLRNATYDAAAELAAYKGPSSFNYGVDNGVKAVQLIGKDYDDPLFEKAIEELTLQDLCNQYIALLQEMKTLAMPVESRADSPLGLIATIGQRTAGTIYEVSADTEGYGHHTDVYVSAPIVAATFSPFLQEEEGRLIGNDALWTGYHVWFGPGMNLHRTPYNGRNLAYYSEDGILTGLASTYVHRALNRYGVVTNTKHFAFNDQETNRDGIAVFMHEQAARENELRGYQMAIRDGGLKGLMTAFNRIGCTHVGADKGLMNGILRGEWGFKGFVMTDSVKSSKYFLSRETLMAGNDQMLGGSNNGKVWGMTEDAVKQDIVVQAALRETYHRKLYVHVNSNLLNGMTDDSASRGGQVWWVTLLMVMIGMSGLCFVLFTVLFVIRYQKERKERI